MKILFGNKIFINQIYGDPSAYFVKLIEKLKNLNCSVKISGKLHCSSILIENEKNE